MAKQRPIVGPISAPPALQPMAHPVSTYADPINGGGPAPSNDFLDLAHGLRAFAPGLEQYADRWVGEQKVAGAADRLTQDQRDANQKALGQAVKAGKLPAGANPWFRKGWDQQDAEINGHQYNNALETWYASSDAKNIDDPKVFQDHVAQFTNGYMTEKGLQAHPELDQILAPMIGQAQTNLTAAHTQYRIQETEKKVAEGADTLSRQSISDGIRAGEDPADTALVLQAIAQRNIQNGQSPLVANKIAAGAVINEAKDTLNLKTLDLLDQFDTGNGKLGKVGWVKELRADAEHEISSRLLTKAAQDHVLGERAQKDASEKLHGDMLTDRLTNPNFDLHAWQMKAAAVDPKLAGTFGEFNKAFLEGNVAVQEDPADLARLYARVNDPNKPLTDEDLVAEAAAKHIGVVSVGQLHQEIQRAKGRSPLDDDVMRQYSSNVDEAIAGSGYTRNPKLNQFGINGKLMFQRSFSDWLQANPKASMPDKMDQAQKLYDRITAAWKRPEDSNGKSLPPLSDLEPAHESPAAALAAPADSEAPAFKDPAAFDAAILKFNASSAIGKPSGLIVELARKKGIDPTALIEQERAKLRTASKPKK